MLAISPHAAHPNFYEIRHPLVLNKLSLLRDQKTDHKQFRELLTEITLLLAYEATHNLPITTQSIQTPLTRYEAPVLTGPAPVILPILRAGLGMVDALLSLLPAAKVGHIGLYRDEKTHQPESYYFKIPKDTASRKVYLCDPMLATGGSVIQAVTALKKEKVQDMTLICLLATPEGLTALQDAHPEVTVFAASLDQGLDENAYIRPGLGDAGDRMFGTL